MQFILEGIGKACSGHFRLVDSTRSVRIQTLFAGGLVLCLAARLVEAHPISLSSATVDARENQVMAELQIMLEDLVLYYGLKSGGDYRYPPADLNQAAERHREFLLKYFSIRDAMGNRVPGEIIDLDKSMLTNGVPQGELMTKSLLYQLKFPLESPQEYLTITQTFGGPNAVLPAVMDLMLLQNGILVETPMQLTLGQPYTARFDWKNPPSRPPKGLAGFRKKRERQLRERLGIGSYGGLYSFIYITATEVRHEILIPLLTFEQWLPIKRRDSEFLDVNEQEAAREGIANFFRDSSPVMIDGLRVAPELTRLNFFSLDINDFALNAEPRRVSVFQARIGVILSYPARRSPERVEVRWDLFNQFAPFLRSVMLIGEAAPAEHFFRQETSAYEWTGKLTSETLHPVKPVPARAGRLWSEGTDRILRQTLSNIYGAFDFRDDSDVYDALAAGVTGSLLRDLYLQIKRSLLMAEQGGAVSKVREVKVVSARLKEGESKDAFEALCSWRVAGTVEHWGHIHTRENEYEAILSMTASGGFWRLSSIEILGEKRVRFETSLRGYDRDQRP